MGNETISETRARLRRMEQTVRRLVLVHIVIMAAALALLLALRRIALPAVLVLAGVAFHIFAVRRANRRYAEAAAEAGLRYGLCAGLEDFRFQGRGGIDREALRRWALLPFDERGNSVLCFNSFRGNAGEYRYFGGEITVHYGAVAANGKTRYRFLSGTLLTAEADAVSGKGDWLLLREELIDERTLEKFLDAHGYRRGAALLEGWDIFTRGEPDVLPDGLAREVLRVSDAAERLAALRFAPEGAAAYLDRRFYTGSGVPTNLSEQALRTNTLPERDELWSLFRNWIKDGAFPEKNS